MNKKIFLLLTVFATTANAATIEKNTAKLQAMDKITGTSKILEIAVNSQQDYEDFSIVVRKCKTNPPEETPENFAFVDIAETSRGETKNIYKGWMLSSSPALNPLEHPMYDLWLLECVNSSELEVATTLSPEELKLRDEMKSTQKTIESVEEIIETQEEPIAEEKTESIINVVDTKIEFNAIEEEKAKEAMEAQEDSEENLKEPEVVETKEVIKENTPEEVITNMEVLELLNENKKEEKSQEKSQLIDFSNMNMQ